MTRLSDFGITHDGIASLAHDLWLGTGKSAEVNWLRAELILLHKALHVEFQDCETKGGA